MSKLSDLARVLHQKTMNNKLVWDLQDDDAISINIGKNSIFIARYSTDEREWLKMSVQNIEGATLDEERYYHDDDIYSSLEELMLRARRNSLRVDETLDEILQKVSRM